MFHLPHIISIVNHKAPGSFSGCAHPCVTTCISFVHPTINCWWSNLRTIPYSLNNAFWYPVWFKAAVSFALFLAVLLCFFVNKFVPLVRLWYKTVGSDKWKIELNFIDCPCFKAMTLYSCQKPSIYYHVGVQGVFWWSKASWRHRIVSELFLLLIHL